MLASSITTLVAYLYLFSMLFYIASLLTKHNIIKFISTLFIVAGFGFHVLSYAVRAFDFYKLMDGCESLVLPISSLYDSLHVFALLLIISYIVYEYKTKNRLIGAIITALSAAAVLLASRLDASNFVTPFIDTYIDCVMLVAYILFSFIAYIFFALSATSGYVYLVCKSDDKQDRYYIFWTTATAIGLASLFALLINSIFAIDISSFLHNASTVKMLYLALAIASFIFFRYYGLSLHSTALNYVKDIDIYSKSTHIFALAGYICFTLSLALFYMLWINNDIWSNSWSWTLKDTWMLLTWLIYSSYLLHIRYSTNTKSASVLSLIGFLITIFSFISVNILQNTL